MTKHLALLDDLSRTVLRGNGHTPVDLREQVADLARVLALHAEPASDLTPAVRALVHCLATQPYRMTDSVVALMQDEGLTEDEIFEVIVAASVGAGQARVEAGLAAAGWG